MNGVADELRQLANEIVEKLTRIVEQTQRDTTRDQLAHFTANDITDANAEADVTFRPPPGVVWYLESLLVVSGVAAAVVRVYLDEINDTKLMAKYLGDAQGVVSPAPADRIVYVPQGRPLIVRISGSPAGTTNVVNIRVREMIVEE